MYKVVMLDIIKLVLRKKRLKCHNSAAIIQNKDGSVTDFHNYDKRKKVAKVYGYNSYEEMYEAIDDNSGMYDPNKRYVGCIYVPKNQKGLEECNYMEFESDDIEEYPIEQEEFDLLYSLGAVDAMNENAAVFIEEWEEEIIESPEKIDKALTAIEIFDPKHKYTFTKALLGASKYRIRMDVYF